MTSMTKEIKGPNNLKLKLAPVRRYLKTSRLIALPLDYQIEQAEDIKEISEESEAEESSKESESEAGSSEAISKNLTVNSTPTGIPD